MNTIILKLNLFGYTIGDGTKAVTWTLHSCFSNANGLNYMDMQKCLTAFFSQEMLAFQTDRSVEVKKYIIHFMAVAG